MKPITINAIIDIFKDIADRHQMVYSFGFGTADQFASKTLRFPYIWLEPTTSSITRSNGVLVGFYNFHLYAFDKIEKGDVNYDDTFSDTDFIINTIIAELTDHSTYKELGIQLQDSIQKEPVHEATDDNVNGWQANISLKVVIPLNSCNIPMNSCAC